MSAHTFFGSGNSKILHADRSSPPLPRAPQWIEQRESGPRDTLKHDTGRAGPSQYADAQERSKQKARRVRGIDV
jgi:hypothetical protein